MAANDPGQPPHEPMNGLDPSPGDDPTAGDSGSGSHGSWTTNLDVPASALAIGAHPDDVEFGAGGTLAKWAAAGCLVHHLVCTDGSKGTWDVEADVIQLAGLRQAEQREASRRLAGDRSGEVRFLGEVDGVLTSGLSLRERVAMVIRELQPAVVLGHDPWKRYRLHPDHRHAGLLTCDAVVAARDPHFYPDQGLAAHRPSALLLWEADEPNHAEDVSATVDHKLAALEAHESQFESTMHARDASELDGFRDEIRSRLGELGRPHGFDAAELFRLITDL